MKGVFKMNEKEIEARNEILEKHQLLQDEYNNLCYSNNLLTSQEWQKMQERKESIMIEIDKLRAIERTWNDTNKTDQRKFNLQMLTIKDVSMLLNCGRDQVRMFIEVGMLHPIKTGKNYMFLQDDLYNFQQTYKGKDISNLEKALLVYEEVREAS